MKRNYTNPKITPEIAANLDAIEAMGDDNIDLSDMPEITDWSNAVRGDFFRPVKKQVTLRLDADVIHWFKTHAGEGRGYQTKINAALRRFVEEETRAAKA